MIKLELIPDSNIVKAQIRGELDDDDWDDVAPQIDSLIKDYGEIRLLLDATQFDGWDDFDAAKAHFAFVKQRHDKVKRVALIADKHWKRWFAGAASRLVDAQMRIFASAERAAAGRWLAGEDIDGPAVTILYHGETDVLGLAVNGKIRSEDYEQVIIPAAEEMIATHGSIKMFIELSHFSGMEIGAFWDDFTFGINHLSDFKRIAVVGDQKWLDWAAKVADAVTKFELKAFPSGDSAAAWGWLQET